jgi:hypothetical protein
VDSKYPPDYPCLYCGHHNENHTQLGYKNQTDPMICCMACYSGDKKVYFHDYIHDNLTYIERLAKERNLV